MIFDPGRTSLSGGGLKHFAWHLGDPELENRFEGCCVECGQFGKFNKVAQDCNCSGIMVIQFDHMPLERERIGESELKKRRDVARIKARAEETVFNLSELMKAKLPRDAGANL